MRGAITLFIDPPPVLTMFAIPYYADFVPEDPSNLMSQNYRDQIGRLSIPHTGQRLHNLFVFTLVEI